MSFGKITLVASVLALFLVCSVEAVFGCECKAPAWNNRAVSDELENAETVITVTLVSFSEPDDTVDQRGGKLTEPSIKMRVEKVYKGNVKTGDILTFGQAGGKDCLWYFSKEDVGKGFLFYLDKPTKARPYATTEETEGSSAEAKYYVSTCGRSAEIDKAVSDILYLDKISRGLIRPEFSFRRERELGG